MEKNTSGNQSRTGMIYNQEKKIWEEYTTEEERNRLLTQEREWEEQHPAPPVKITYK